MQLSSTGQQQQDIFFASNPNAKSVMNVNQYGDDTNLYDHRDKLNNSFMEHFKLHQFYEGFRTLDETQQSSMQLRKILYKFAAREIEKVCPAYDNIRKTVHNFFYRLNSMMIKSSEGYFWRQKSKTLRLGEK